MKRGLFITVEGGDGAGKTTQLEFIKKYLAEKGEDVLFTREPGGTPISEKIRGLILDKENEEMDYMTETMLYAASRAQLVAQVIKPAIEHGKVVVCDRYVDSSIAYQGYGRDMGECVSIINSYAIDGCVPDATILIKVDPRVGRGRINPETFDRLESAGETFHDKVYRGYLALEEQYPERIIGINGSQTIEEVNADIARELDNILRRWHVL